MAARETKPNGKSQLIRDLKNGEFARCTSFRARKAT